MKRISARVLSANLLDTSNEVIPLIYRNSLRIHFTEVRYDEPYFRVLQQAHKSSTIFCQIILFDIYYVRHY